MTDLSVSFIYLKLYGIFFYSVPTEARTDNYRTARLLSAFLSPVPYLILFQWVVRAVLRLEQHCAALQAFQAMPLPFLDIQQNSTWHHIDGIREIALLIIEVL